MLLAGDADYKLFMMPFVSGSWSTLADPVGKALAKLQRPLPDGFVANQDTSGSEHLLDHAQAQQQPKVQPEGMADHLRWETVGSSEDDGSVTSLTYASIRSPSG
jgi:hypothetical protein